MDPRPAITGQPFSHYFRANEKDKREDEMVREGNAMALYVSLKSFSTYQLLVVCVEFSAIQVARRIVDL
jgi:hypothetical protein